MTIRFHAREFATPRDAIQYVGFEPLETEENDMSKKKGNESRFKKTDKGRFALA